MNTNKKIFLVFAVLFLGAMLYLGYDISSRTTFPGSRPQLKERIEEEILEQPDSVAKDSLYDG